MENKETAVDWLVNVVQSCIAPNFIPKEIIAQAKEMEKRQIVDAWGNGFDEDDRATSNPFKYYNETYGGGEQ